jgi:hypothetical protein
MTTHAKGTFDVALAPQSDGRHFYDFAYALPQ